MTDQQLNELLELMPKIHQNAVDKGFHEVQEPQREIALISSELGEFVEAMRKNKRAIVEQYNIMKEEVFEFEFDTTLFGTHIKDTVEDELADTVIRLLDFAGNYKIAINVSLFTYSTKDNNDIYFWHNAIHGLIYTLSKKIINDASNLIIGQVIYNILELIFIIAEILKIDLLWHVKEKMQYNSTREHKHGKLF